MICVAIEHVGLRRAIVIIMMMQRVAAGSSGTAACSPHQDVVAVSE